VKRLQVSEVVSARQRDMLELGDQDRRLLGLEGRQLGPIADREAVAQAVGAGVDVRVGWQRR